MKVDLMLLERIYDNISRGATGCPECMAEKLGISKRYLYVNIDYLKTRFDAPIAYSRSRETFYFTKEWKFYVGCLTHVRAALIKDVLETIGKNIKVVLLIGMLSSGM